jgi:hypothetical protein
MARREDRVVGAALPVLLLLGLFVAGSNGSSGSLTDELGGFQERRWVATGSHRPDPGTLAVGVTHGQYSIDDWGYANARASAKAALAATATYQNQHIFGWGVLNPEPKPGVFDWSSLDQRMRLIRSTAGTPVITLCCAPDWMKGGRPGETDWSRLHVAPSPNHYADFAALAVATARRYPDVRHFQVWNELKGFWNPTLNRWDYEAYTAFYNVVYDALKAFDPALAVGGPYVVVDLWKNPAAGGHPSQLTGACGIVDQRSLDVIEYWLRHKHGADFIALDAGSGTRDAGITTSTTVNSAVFAIITRWVRQRTTLPVWWSEFHVGTADAAGEPQLTARAVAALAHAADAGASAALIWQPQRDTRPTALRPPALWTSTELADGGRPTTYARAVAWLQEILADRAAADLVSWPVPDVGMIHGRDAVLLVHTADGQVEVAVQGRPVRLGPYEVRHVSVPQAPPGDVQPPTVPASNPTEDQCLRLPPQPASPQPASPQPAPPRPEQPQSPAATR